MGSGSKMTVLSNKPIGFELTTPLSFIIWFLTNRSSIACATPGDTIGSGAGVTSPRIDVARSMDNKFFKILSVCR